MTIERTGGAETARPRSGTSGDPEAAGRLLTGAIDALEELVAICRARRGPAGDYLGAEVVWANRFARDRWLGPGTPLEAVIGRDLYEMAPHTAALREEHLAVIETGRPFMGVVAIDHPAGERSIDLHLARLGDGFVIASRDVTEHERLRAAEERFRVELAESEERFRHALDATLDTLAILEAVRDREGAIEDFRIVYANRSWQEIYGEPGIDPIGRRLYADYPFFRPRRELHVRTVQTGDPIRRTLEVAGPPRRWYEFLLTKFGDGYVTASRDVTDRVLAETALAASEARLRDLVGGIDAIVTVEDELTGESWVSPQAERVLGFPAERLADIAFWKSRVHPDDRERIFEVWDHETDEYELEYRMLAADERTIWLRERVVHQFDPERPLDRWLSVAFEITERKELEDQLERVRRMESLGRLAAGVAHDFNNVLYGISILAGYLERGLPDGPLREDARQIVEAVERGSGLTRQLLAFSRGEGAPAIRVRVGDVVREVSRMLERVIGSAIELQVETADAAEIVADPGGLEQAIVNLATNARDAMPEGGSLSIRSDEVELDEPGAIRLELAPGRYVRLRVEDTGVGIPSEMAPRLFEPFATTKPVETGTGLGLSNVYAFVRAAGGAVTFESRPMAGTDFTLLFPVAGRAQASASPG